MSQRETKETSAPQNANGRPITLPITPLHPASSSLSGNTLWYKRDDLIPYALGGNKVRIAAAFFQDMFEKGGTCMVGYGNVRSNLSRVLSWMAKKYGVKCYIISPDEPDNRSDAESRAHLGQSANTDATALNDKPSQLFTLSDSAHLAGADVMTFNRRLSLFYGANIIHCSKDAVAPCVESTINRLREEGEIPYYIYGNTFGKGNEAVPAAPYADVFSELSQQADALSIAPDYLFLPCGTGGTLAGLLYGKYLTDSSMNIVGISIARDREKASSHVRTALHRLGEERKQAIPDAWIDHHLHIDDSYIAGGYGKYNESILDAIRTVLTADGIPLDPTYTGKTWWGMQQYLIKQDIKEKTVVFLHTGGLPLFFDLMEHLDINR
ncbi:MAG: pyridoxal-phosphate dependent enzyme [Clostridiaceae bacterium]|jgi:D-cysteine desulfhydrase|nr:pyridoxal-phosphate dependent enzyme [Clostridiaceae bacterium]